MAERVGQEAVHMLDRGLHLDRAEYQLENWRWITHQLTISMNSLLQDAHCRTPSIYIVSEVMKAT